MSKGLYAGCMAPLLRGGAAAPIKQMLRYLKFGAAGEVRPLFEARL